MPSSPSLKPHKVQSRAQAGIAAWTLNVPSELSPTGKRQRLFFQTEKEARGKAETFKARRDNFGNSLTSITPARIAEAAEAYKILEPLGLDLLSAVKAYAQIFNQRTASVTFGAAFDRFAELKAAKSPNYRREIRETKAKVATLLDRPVCDIAAADLESILADLPSASRNARMRRLRSVFNLAIRRGWMLPGTSPIGRMDFVQIDSKEVQTYGNSEVKAMLENALENDLALVPSLVLGFFCGIRPDQEIQKLDWSDLKYDGNPQIVIRPEVSKTNRRRFIDIAPCAQAWLNAYRARGGSTVGKVVPCGPSRLRVRQRANRLAAGVMRSIQDGARHSFCSNHLAKFEDVNRLVLQSGHDSVDTMWRNYHKGTTKADAEQPGNIVPMVVASA
jgi:integrase